MDERMGISANLVRFCHNMLMGFHFMESFPRAGILKESGGSISMMTDEENFTTCLDKGIPLLSDFICPELRSDQKMRAEREERKKISVQEEKKRKSGQAISRRRCVL